MIWLQEPFDFAAGAILNFRKPLGKSSFWVVKQVRRMINTKVGHAGTLDPFAGGVLLLCTGKATKQVSQFMDLEKVYSGEIQLGIVTNTDDVTGTITNQSDVPVFTFDEINKICQEFTGDIYQIPPMFSAKKVKGKRLYKSARAGLIVERKPSLVHIEEIRVLSYKAPVISIEVRCSKGTYIRSLARDIGEKAGCGAHLKTLERTKIGNFKVKDSLTLEKFRLLLEKAGVVKDD